MKRLLVVLLCLALAGCATTPLGMIRRNMTRGKLNQLELGMDKQQAVALLGNPYRTETLQGKDKIFLVYYYWTDIKQTDGAITDDELTPLVFDNDQLIGWGWSFLQDNAQKYEIRIR